MIQPLYHKIHAEFYIPQLSYLFKDNMIMMEITSSSVGLHVEGLSSMIALLYIFSVHFLTSQCLAFYGALYSTQHNPNESLPMFCRGDEHFLIEALECPQLPEHIVCLVDFLTHMTFKG